MPRVRTITLLATFVVVFAFAGCSEKKEPADAAETVRDQPASPAAPYEAEAETGVTEAPGKALLETRCTVCHNLERVQKKKLDDAGWEEVVKRMVKHGAKLHDAEKEALVTYLAENYGK